MRGYISSDLAHLITRNVEEISFDDNEAPLELRINLGTMRLLLEGQRVLSSTETLPISSLAETCMEGDAVHSGSSVDEEPEDESMHNDEPFNSPPSIFSPASEFVPGSELRRVSGRRILPKINGHDGTFWMHALARPLCPTYAIAFPPPPCLVNRHWRADSKKKAITAVKKMKQIAKGALAMMDQ